MEVLNQHLLLELLDKMPMDVLDAHPYFGTFVRINAVDKYAQFTEIRLNLCDWKFLEDLNIRASSDDESTNWKSVIATLNGCKLLSLVHHNEKYLELKFSDGKSFMLNANTEYYGDDGELIVFYAPDKYSIEYSPEKGYFVPD